MTLAYDYAMKYYDMGLNIIPVEFLGKDSAFFWKEFQGRQCTTSELKTWFEEQLYNVGIVCDKIFDGSGMYFCSLDFDSPEYIQYFFPDIRKLKEETVVVRSKRGIHVWFLSKAPVSTFKIIPFKLDVKGKGSYIMAPPSYHESGTTMYEFEGQSDKIAIVDDLEDYIKTMAEAKGEFADIDRTNVYLNPEYGLNHHSEGDVPECMLNISQGVQKGSRDDAAFLYAAYLRFYQKLEIDKIREIMSSWNLKNKPPLDKTQLDKCIKQGLSYTPHCSKLQNMGLCTKEMEGRCPMERRLITIKVMKNLDPKKEEMKSQITQKIIESKIDKGTLDDEPYMYAIKMLKPVIPFVQLTKLYTENVVEVTEDKSLKEKYFSSSKVNYDIWLGFTHSSGKPFFIIDKYELIQPGINSSYFVVPKFNSLAETKAYINGMSKIELTKVKNSLKHFGIKSDREIMDYLFQFMAEVHPRFSNLEYLDKFDWKHFVNELLTFKARKDSRLYTFYKATLLRGIKMKFAPHAIISTNIATGKSTFYEYAGMKLDAATPNSLIGYAKGKDEIYPGSLNGQVYPICLDQVESIASDKLASQLLSFLEEGRMKWDKGGVNWLVSGKFPLIIAANPIGYVEDLIETKVVSFSQLLDVMSANVNALGRRFGLIIYGTDYKKVELVDKSFDESVWKELFEVYRSIELMALPKLEKLFKESKILEWLNSDLPEYAEKVLGYIQKIREGINDVDVMTFLESNAFGAYRHIRGGALNCSIIDLIPQILKENTTTEEIIELAEKYLKNILDINLESIGNFTDSLQSHEEIVKMMFRHHFSKNMQKMVLALENYKKENKASKRSVIVTLKELEECITKEIGDIKEIEKEIKSMSFEKMEFENKQLKKRFGFMINTKPEISLLIEDWDKPNIKLEC